MRGIILVSLTVLLIQTGLAQQNVAINTTGALPHASAQLDISSNSKGLLIPRMNSMQRVGISSPATGLLVFDTTTNSFWYYNGTTWINLASTLTSWGLNGNAGTNPSSNYIGTSDNNDLRFKLNAVNAGLLSNNGNVFWGLRSGLNNTTGYSNVGIGIDALKLNTDRSNLIAIGDSALYNNTSGTENTSVGSKALYTNTSGEKNTAAGFQSLYSNNIGIQNNAFGYQALFSNSSGSNNTAFGTQALYSNITGFQNVAIGRNALRLNTSGHRNNATGTSALSNNTIGFSNAAFGDAALNLNTSGNSNTAIGANALLSNTTGSLNIAIGADALGLNTTKSNLVAVGDSSMFNNTGSSNVAVGSKSLYSNTTGSKNTAHGYHALFSNMIGSSNVAIGNAALKSNTHVSNLVAIGDSALYSNTGPIGGIGNTAIGSKALFSNTIGVYNTAVGYQALSSHTESHSNTAVGYRSLYNDINGSANSAYGRSSLEENTYGFSNSAFGFGALNYNTTGWINTAMGIDALYSNSSGQQNTAVGGHAMDGNLDGSNNSAFGFLARTASGSLNNATAIGAFAQVNCSNCFVLGSVNAVNSGTSDVNVGIGENSPGFPLNFKSSTGDKISFFGNSGAHYGIGVEQYLLQIHTDLLQSDIAFGYGRSAVFTETMRIKGNGNVGIGTSNPQSKLHLANGGTLRIYNATNTRYAELFHSDPNGNLHLDAFGGGSSYISWNGGSGLHVGNGTGSTYGPVNASAFTTASSIAFKKEIRNIPYGLDQILQLKGKQYKYINDSTNRNEIGLIAEEVEKVLPEVVYRNTPDKQITGIDYGKLTPVIIEAIKELKRQINELKQENAEIKKMLKNNN